MDAPERRPVADSWWPVGLIRWVADTPASHVSLRPARLAGCQQLSVVWGPSSGSAEDLTEHCGGGLAAGWRARPYRGQGDSRIDEQGEGPPPADEDQEHVNWQCYGGGSGDHAGGSSHEYEDADCRRCRALTPETCEVPVKDRRQDGRMKMETADGTGQRKQAGRGNGGLGGHLRPAWPVLRPAEAPSTGFWH